MSTEWPPQLKEWVGKCLGKMTDANRMEAQAEMKKVIADAFSAKALWTTDWSSVQLQALQPKSSLSFNNFNGVGNLKRKTNDSTVATPKKAKKNALAKVTPVDFNDQVALNRRAQRFAREHEIERQRSTGFKASNSVSSFSGSPSYTSFTSDTHDDPEVDPNVPNWDRYTIVGTSTNIFKDYLRLTSEPKPDQIRPYTVLQQTLVELKKKWREKAQYNWICSQFKSLRQDLTVQRIKNEFTATVYEIHARIALEVSDMVEYNQCLSQLRLLYESGINGKVDEFTAYRILMLLHGLNRSELNLYITQLTPHQKSQPAVTHALAVQRALALGNYHKLFRLYVEAPNMGAYIMDHFIDRERVKALMVMSRAYQKLDVAHIATELAFGEVADAVTFLAEHKAAFFSNPNAPDADKILECKPCYDPLAQIFEEKYRKVVIKGRI